MEQHRDQQPQRNSEEGRVPDKNLSTDSVRSDRDISSIDQQEGRMENGELGGNPSQQIPSQANQQNNNHGQER
jgi:hypothetical protein